MFNLFDFSFNNQDRSRQFSVDDDSFKQCLKFDSIKNHGLVSRPPENRNQLTISNLRTDVRVDFITRLQNTNIPKEGTLHSHDFGRLRVLVNVRSFFGAHIRDSFSNFRSHSRRLPDIFLKRYGMHFLYAATGPENWYLIISN